MRRLSLVLVTALAACTTTPTATPGVASPSPSAVTPTAAPTPAPTLVPSFVTEQIGRLTVTHPRDWRLVAGPAGGPFSPLFYLSTGSLTVQLCPTADPTTGAYAGCPPPLPELAPNGVLVTVWPNRGLPAAVPPIVRVEAASGACQAIGGDAQMQSVVGASVVGACLRGPDVAPSEADVRTVIDSLARPSS